MRALIPFFVCATTVLVSRAPAQFPTAHELPGDLAFAPAAGEQRHASLARGNAQSLVVYEDHRAALGDTVAYTSTGTAVINAARFDDAGNLIDTTPISVRKGTNSPRDPRVAWNGSTYLVVWDELVRNTFQSDRAVFAARVDTAGQLLDDPPILIADSGYVDESYPVVASDGASWAIAWSGLVGGADVIQGRMLDANGVASPAQTLMTAAIGFYFPVSFELAWSNGRYLFVSQHGAPGSSSTRIHGQLFDPALNPIGGEFAISSGSSAADACVAGNGTDFCVAWRYVNQLVRATPVSATGNVVVPGGVDLMGPVLDYAGYQLPAVTWDGTDWQIAFGTSSGLNGALNVATLSPSGVLAGGAPVTISQGAWSLTRPACAPSASGVQVVWDDTRNNAQPIAGFASDRTDILSSIVLSGGSASAAIDVSVSPPAQLDPQIAGDAVQGYLAAFFSVTQSTTTVNVQRLTPAGAPIDAQPIALVAGPRTLHDLALAWNGFEWLAAWEDFATTGSTVRGMRIAANGTVLDAVPVEFMPGNDPALAAVNGDFLVAATNGPTAQLRFVYTRRVRGSDGVFLDAAPVQRTNAGYDGQVSVAAFDDRWIVAWVHMVTHDSPSSTVRYFIADAGGAVSPTDLAGVSATTSGNNEPVLATDRFTEALLVWTSGGDVLGRRILRDGTKLDTDGGFVISNANTTQFAPSVAWNGDTFLAAFTDYRAHVNVLETGIGDVFATHIAADGTVLEPSGVAVAQDLLTPEGRPSVAGGASTTFVAFDALRTGAPFGNWRIAITVEHPPAGTEFCSSGTLGLDHATPCPCGNNGASENGCAHSFSAAGAHLSALGQVVADDVVLRASGMPVSSFTLFMQHTSSGDTIFHDGVLCAGGGLTRLRGRAAALGEASFPNTAYAQDATTTLSLRGGVFPGAGVRRHYAAWYRNASSTFCPPATANVSNGYFIDW